MKPQEAIGIIKIALAEVEWEYPMDYAAAFETAIEAMEKQATSNYTSEWIPVSERLPEDENEVLITVNGKFNNITFDNAIEIGFYNEVDGWIINGYLDWITPEVIAWMPLPRRGARV